jgi:hypothetical protein
MNPFVAPGDPAHDGGTGRVRQRFRRGCAGGGPGEPGATTQGGLSVAPERVADAHDAPDSSVNASRPLPDT